MYLLCFSDLFGASILYAGAHTRRPGLHAPSFAHSVALTLRRTLAALRCRSVAKLGGPRDPIRGPTAPPSGPFWARLGRDRWVECGWLFRGKAIPSGWLFGVECYSEWRAIPYGRLFSEWRAIPYGRLFRVGGSFSVPKLWSPFKQE